MNIPDIKILVTRETYAHLDRVEDGALWYGTDYRIGDGAISRFEFPVPLSDVDGAVFRSQERCLYLMRWIRARLAYLRGVASEMLASTTEEPT